MASTGNQHFVLIFVLHIIVFFQISFGITIFIPIIYFGNAPTRRQL